MATKTRDFGPAYNVSFSPDGSRLLRSRQSKVYVHDVASGEELGLAVTGPGGSESALVGDGLVVVDRAYSTRRRAFDAVDGSTVWTAGVIRRARESHEKPLTVAVNGVTIVDPVHLASGTSRIDVIAGLTGETRSFERDPYKIVSCVAVPGRDQLLLLEQVAADEDRFALTWFDPHDGTTSTENLDPALVPSHPHVALWSSRAAAPIIQDLWGEVVHGGNGRRRELKHVLGQPAMSPDGRWFVVAGSDQPIQILDTESLETISMIPIGASSFAAGPCFSPGGGLLAVTIDNRACVFDLTNPAG